jgi:Fe-Mn family superoxide dismutase
MIMKKITLALLVLSSFGFSACAQKSESTKSTVNPSVAAFPAPVNPMTLQNGANPSTDAFVLPPLGYAFNALEPVIDAMTMEIHHDKHHATYVTNLNKAMTTATQYSGKGLEQIFAELRPEETAIRNNGGGHWNHSMFWNWIKPGGAKEPSADLKAAIEASFGSMDEFKKQFSDAAKLRFGSGWAWLNVGADGKLFISSTANQDNPLMVNVVEKAGKPILGLDVWEHAYYLNYQNKRADYVTAFFSIINWDEVEKMWRAAKK